MPGGPQTPVGWREDQDTRAAATSIDHPGQVPQAQVFGSRSVIVRGGQNPSRAPSASASPHTLD
jgi:hypothetical protein